MDSRRDAGRGPDQREKAGEDDVGAWLAAKFAQGDKLVRSVILPGKIDQKGGHSNADNGGKERIVRTGLTATLYEMNEYFLYKKRTILA